MAYHLLSREGVARGWKVPLFVTLGSPLGVTAIRKAMKQLTNVQRCPSCAAAWFNAMDERDVPVALPPVDHEVVPIGTHGARHSRTKPTSTTGRTTDTASSDISMTSTSALSDIAPPGVELGARPGFDAAHPDSGRSVAIVSATSDGRSSMT